VIYGGSGADDMYSLDGLAYGDPAEIKDGTNDPQDTIDGTPVT